MAGKMINTPTATKNKCRPPDEKKAVAGAAPDAEYLASLERLNRQCNGNALLRLSQIIGSRKKGLPALLPVGKTSFWERVKSGIYPAPVRLGKKTVAWRYRDIMEILETGGATNTTEKGGHNNE